MEDPHFLVVEKPAGIPVHPLSLEDGDTLVQRLVPDYPEIAKVGKDPREMGLAHRLDNDTSGLLLIARDQKSWVFFREEFQKHRIEKEYEALVLGEVKIKKDKFRIDFPIAHHPKNKKKMKVDVRRGREAVTFFSVEKIFQGFSLLKIQIATGVRHQIRVHLAHLGHPLVGDVLYGGEKVRLQNFPRVFLHATRLAFRHPETLQKIECVSKLPEDFFNVKTSQEATDSGQEHR